MTTRYKHSHMQRRHKGKWQRRAKTEMQVFREVELYGFSGSYVPKYKRDKHER